MQLHCQPLFSPHRNWMSATELSRILMRVVSESKLLTWGVGIEHRPRSGGVECSQMQSATARLEMSEFITSGPACPQSAGGDGKLHSCFICPIMGIFFGWCRQAQRFCWTTITAARWRCFPLCVTDCRCVSFFFFSPPPLESHTVVYLRDILPVTLTQLHRCVWVIYN